MNSDKPLDFIVLLREFSDVARVEKALRDRLDVLKLLPTFLTPVPRSLPLPL